MKLHRLLVPFLVAALAACASPRSDQGQGQGGATGPVPTNQVVINFNGPVHVESLATPTAAPSATSAAKNEQTAPVSVTPAVGDSAIEALKPDVLRKIIGGDGTVAPAVVHEPTPGEPPR